MTTNDALEILRRLAASGSHVMVRATMRDGSTVALFDSPVDAAQAVEAVEAVDRTQLAVSYSVRRDESGLGITY